MTYQEIAFTILKPTLVGHFYSPILFFSPPLGLRQILLLGWFVINIYLKLYKEVNIIRKWVLKLILS